jgi:hypothetical protein
MMKKTIKQQLLEKGMKEEHFDNWASDLYVLKNDISTEWINSYEYKNQVKPFRSETDKGIWYEIPFGYIPEYIESKNK